MANSHVLVACVHDASLGPFDFSNDVSDQGSKDQSTLCDDKHVSASKMTTPEVPLGAKVQVSAGVGYVRWTGANPKFSAGKWVGVEL